MLAMRSLSFLRRALAMAIRLCQKASSRLTLVLCPESMIERLTISDFILRLLATGQFASFTSRYLALHWSLDRLQQQWANEVCFNQCGSHKVSSTFACGQKR